jgi:hypothetical protein
MSLFFFATKSIDKNEFNMQDEEEYAELHYNNTMVGIFIFIGFRAKNVIFDLTDFLSLEHFQSRVKNERSTRIYFTIQYLL